MAATSRNASLSYFSVSDVRMWMSWRLIPVVGCSTRNKLLYLQHKASKRLSSAFLVLGESKRERRK